MREFPRIHIWCIFTSWGPCHCDASIKAERWICWVSIQIRMYLQWCWVSQNNPSSTRLKFWAARIFFHWNDLVYVADIPRSCPRLGLKSWGIVIKPLNKSQRIWRMSLTEDCRKMLWQTKTSLHWNKHKIHFFHCVFLHSFVRFALLIL